MLADNGTLKGWQVDGIDVIYPERKVVIDGIEKLRGGAPVCCPIFGKMPETPDYEGLDLPQHGLVRLGDRHVYKLHTSLNRNEMILSNFSGIDSYLMAHYEYYRVVYEKPWEHTITILLKTLRTHPYLEHDIRVLSTPVGNQKRMPASIALHPYFSTMGEEFTIVYGRQTILSGDIQEGVSRQIEATMPIINLAHGQVVISTHVSSYTGFNIWTDDIKKYICVEPYYGIGGIHYLPSFQPLICRCQISFKQK